MIKLKDIKTELEKFLVLKDGQTVDVIFCNLFGNCVIPGNPIWTMIVAPSSGGKSTLLAPLSGVSQCYFVDDLTEKTFLSGFKMKGGKETSLLKIIGNGIMIFSDFSSILSKNSNQLGEILSQLRLVYDQKLVKHTGTGKVDWKGKIGFLGAATPSVYHDLEAGKALGERFIFYYMSIPTDDEIADKKASVDTSARDFELLMVPFYKDYFSDTYEWVRNQGGVRPLDMTAEQKLRLKRAAKFCVEGKATVHFNYKSGKVDRIPDKASLGRDYAMFITCLRAYQLMDSYEAQDYMLPLQEARLEIIERHAYSSINREKRKVLEILANADETLSASQIGTKNNFGMEKESVEQYLHPLHAVGLVQKVAGNPHKWYIANEETKDWIKRVSGQIVEITPHSKDDPLLNPIVEESNLDSLADEFKLPAVEPEIDSIWGNIEIPDDQF